MEKTGRKARLAGLVVLAGFIGYLIGPPLVEAATNQVIIKDPRTPRKARVQTGGALKVRPNGGFTDVSGSFVVDFPVGVGRLATGSADETVCPNGAVVGVLTEIAINGGTGGGSVAVSGAGQLIWSGSAAEGEQLSMNYGFGVTLSGPLTVDVTGNAQWFLYGECFEAGGLASREAIRERLERALARS